MEWLTSLFDVGTGGVVTGVFGGLIGGVAKYFQEKQRQAWEEKKWSHDKEMAKMNIKADSDKLAATISADAARADKTALSQSIQADASLSNINTPPWALAVKVVFRPFLTTILIVVYAMMYYLLLEALKVGGALTTIFDPNEMGEILKYMIYTMVFTTSTAATWWFCDRAITPSFAK